MYFVCNKIIMIMKTKIKERCILLLIFASCCFLGCIPGDEARIVTEPQQVSEWAEKFHDPNYQLLVYFTRDGDERFVDLYAISSVRKELILSYGIGEVAPCRALEPHSVTLYPGRIPLRGEALAHMRGLARPYVETALDSLAVAVHQ